MKKRLMTTLALAGCGVAMAKVDLVTIPTRDSVQLTIYNSADMTLVRERRALTLKKGDNTLQFSWVNTLIDPTSLEMVPKQNADKIDIQDLVFPPRVKNLGLWNINSRISGKSPVEISYLTSGLSWRAFYMGTLTPDEKTLRLQGYVRVTNQSGEDYENAQTRLIVGKVHILDQIAQLARRQYPHDRPHGPQPMPALLAPQSKMRSANEKFGRVADGMMQEAVMKRKEIKKEGLSEYFLYTIDGTETIPNGWSKRLPSFDIDKIPVINLYKFEEERYRNQVRRFLSFKNDEKHELGETPIPGGAMKVFRTVDQTGSLAYEGTSSFKYIPVDEKVELDLGAVQNVIVEATLMKQATDQYKFNRGNISGWNEIYNYEVEVRNTRSVPIKIEIKRNFNTAYWKLKKSGDYGKYEKDDKDTIKFTLELPPKSKKEFTYQLTTYHGENQ